MVAEVTDIKGIGPAKADTLAENGYESVEDVANANPDELAEVDGVGDDRALEFIVGAEDVLEAEAEVEEAHPEDEPEGEAFDLTPSEVSDAVEESEEAEDSPESDSSDEDDESPSEGDGAASAAPEEPDEDEDDDPDLYELHIDFENRRQYDTYHAAIMRHHERHFRGNQTVSDAMEMAIDGLDSFDSVEYELTEEQFNAIHAGVSQLRTSYQGDNLIDHMDELNVVLDQINEQRREQLF